MAVKSKAQLFINAAPEPTKLIRVGRKISETKERIEKHVKRDGQIKGPSKKKERQVRKISVVLESKAAQ